MLSILFFYKKFKRNKEILIFSGGKLFMLISKIKKYIVILIILLIIEACIVPIISATIKKDKNQSDNEKVEIVDTNFLGNGYINITVFEAWEMLNSTEDGRQILIDVRRWEEYTAERIDAPHPEDWPRWFPYELTSGGPGPIVNEGILLKIFMRFYKGKEIIIYCRTARRTGITAQILVDNGFQGTVYNMLGGITEWKAQGFPTVEGLIPFT